MAADGNTAEQFARTLQAHQRLHLLKAAPAYFIGNPLGIAVLLLVGGSRIGWEAAALFLSLAVGLVAPVARRWHRTRHRHGLSAADPTGTGRHHRGPERTILLSLLLGLLWMAVALYVGDRVPSERETGFLGVLAVMILGASASAAAVPLAALAYALPPFLALALTLSGMSGDATSHLLTLAGLAAAFAITLWGNWQSFRQTVTLLAGRDALLVEKTAEVDRRQRTEAILQRSLDRLRTTQQQLVEQEKLASLGQLVAGVAHEINTPVGIALTGATVLRNETRRLKALADEGTARKSDVQRYFALAEETSELLAANCQRAADLVQSFKQVAVDQASEARREVALAAYLNEILFSLRPKLKGRPVTVSIDCPHTVVMDTYPGCISQVVTNFIMNSLLHGFAPEQEGQITLTVTAPSRDVVELAYRDDGKGIPEELHGRIFEPFFTTKRGQGGTGLGLHVVYSLVTNRLKGELALESRAGAGVLFRLTLPRVTPGPAESADGAGVLIAASPPRPA